MKTFFRNVCLLDGTATEGVSPPINLRVTEGVIAEIGSDLMPNADEAVIEGQGDLLMPGLVNGHFHSSVNHMKGRLPGMPLEIFMLYECPELNTLRPTPREAYLRTMLGCIEMLETGTTAVQDDCFFVPEPEPDIMDAVMQAYADSGIRARLAIDQPEVPELDKLPFLSEQLPPSLKAELSRPARVGQTEMRALYRHLIDRWHGAADGRLQAAVSISAPQRVTPEYFAELDEVSRTHDLPFYAHMLETRLQRVFGQERLEGRSLVRYTADLGLLSDRMNIIHAIWIDEPDMDLIAASNATVAHNPNSNLRLGSGIMPFRALRDRGVNICLGVDEAIADDAVNMWLVMKTAGMIHSLTEPDWLRWPQAAEILAAATVGGGVAMRVPGLGRLEVGAPADLNLIDLSALAYLPLNNAARQLVHCETGSSVRLTMVAGRVVAKSGRVCHLDRAGLLAEAAECLGAKRRAVEAAAVQMDGRLPFYRDMYLRAMRTPVPMVRRIESADPSCKVF
ncbi:MAG: amidohydrolase family protein [Pseudotabrizicola sp.]|uniref:amidohydrolase family protein n=1 Tax=Pseudotabrizicola sp. TaxID=2939647 RepID=UPI00272F152E|nr:amidohydrolase family protein [Pseudotabrizicola sp.]MDP2079864.1 amidohydrolase family protein [Pseudotabrizicola sp.]MDZ7573189.1 amidohydrolase family protein [Pseudotabrizicola sp.]